MSQSASVPVDPSPQNEGRPLLWRVAVFAVLLGVTLYFCVNAPQASPGEEVGVSMTLPPRVLGYSGTAKEASRVETDILPSGTEFSKMIYEGSGVPIDLSIVLSGENRNSIHKPEICLVGQGWIIESSTARVVELSNEETLEVMDLSLSRPHLKPDGTTITVRAHYVYWFAGGNITTPYHNRRIIYSSLDNIIEGLNHRWAYVSAMAYVSSSFDPNGFSDTETVRQIDAFIAESVPQFQKTFVSKRSWSHLVPFL